MRWIFLLVSSTAILSGCNTSRTQPPYVHTTENRIWTVDGVFDKGEFIDLGKVDRLYIRYSPIADSGVELERVVSGKTVWRVQSTPLGISHTGYTHKVNVKIKDQMVYINSLGSGGNFYERRCLATGSLVKRNEKNILKVKTK